MRNNSHETSLPALLLEALERVGIKGVFRRRHIVLGEGDPGRFVYFILEGTVKLVKLSPVGRQKILNILKRGSIFGELSLSDPGPSPYGAVTLEEAVILLVPVAEVRQLMWEHRELGQFLMAVMAKGLRREYRSARNAFLDTSGKVASKLYKLAKDFGVPVENGWVANLPINRTELSDYIGISRESVSRILGELERQGVLTAKNRQIIIHDMEGLKKTIAPVQALAWNKEKPRLHGVI